MRVHGQRVRRSERDHRWKNVRKAPCTWTYAHTHREAKAGAATRAATKREVANLTILNYIRILGDDSRWVILSLISIPWTVARRREMGVERTDLGIKTKECGETNGRPNSIYAFQSALDFISKPNVGRINQITQE